MTEIRRLYYWKEQSGKVDLLRSAAFPVHERKLSYGSIVFARSADGIAVTDLLRCCINGFTEGLSSHRLGEVPLATDLYHDIHLHCRMACCTGCFIRQRFF